MKLEEWVVPDKFDALDNILQQLLDLFTSFQRKHIPTTRTSCPLCKMDLSIEHVYYESDWVLIVDTNKKKGHRNRIMVLTKKHGIQHNLETLNEAIRELVTIGRQIFDEDFILLSDRYSSVNYHWHIIASDIDPESDDYQQIMKTPYVLIKQELPKVAAH